MASSSPDAEKKLALPDGLDAGDIILFNRRCSAMGLYGAAVCVTAKLYYNTKWDHIGIVVREKDGSLQLLDAGFGGVRKYPLYDRLERSKSNDICVRRLAIARSDKMRQKLLDFSNEVVDASYKKQVRDLLRIIKTPSTAEVERLNALAIELQAEIQALQKQTQQVAVTSQPVLLAELNRVERQLEIVQWRLKEEHGMALPQSLQERFDVQRGVFCSELVAAAYQRLDLLANYPAAHKYSPNDFSSGADTPLFLLNNAFLGPEEYIKRDRRPIKAPTLPRTCTMDRQLLEQALRKTRLEGLLEDERRTQQFLQALTPVVMQPGQVLFSPGDFADGFYIVESGKLERLMKPQGSEDGEQELVTSLRAGSSIGERGMIYETPRTTTCRAVEKSLLWRCDRTTFRQLLVEFVDHHVVRDFTEKRQLYSILSDHFLFKRLDRIPGPEVVERFFNVELKAGETLWKEGMNGDNFYVIKAGEMEVYERGRLSYALGPGDTFGASALIYDTPRYYTIVAKTPVQCWAINSHDFHQLHLSQNAQHLKKAFESHCISHKGTKIMTPEQFLEFSHAKENFPPEKYERLAGLLVALVTFNRLGRKVPFALEELPGPVRLIHPDVEPEQIRFFEFVRFHLTIDRPSSSLAAEIAFKLVDRFQRGTVNLQALRNFLTEVYGAQAASDQLAKMAVDDPKAMSAWLKAESVPLNMSDFKRLYASLPAEVKEDMELLANQSLKFVVPALRKADASDHRAPSITPTALPTPTTRFSHLNRRKLLLMQLTAVFSVTAVAPLERLQIIRQTVPVKPSRGVGVVRARNAFAILWRKDGGLRGLLRGNSASVARILPATGIQYVLMETFANYHSPGLYQEIFYGALAGVTSAAITYPFDVLRGRAAVFQGPGFSMRRYTLDLIRKEGIRPLFRGIVPSIVGVFPYVGANFGMYQYYVLQGSAESLRLDRHMAPTAVIFWASMACMGHLALLYPLDTCRRCMQVDPNCGGTLHVLRTLYQERGFRGLYGGLLPGLLRVTPAMFVGMAAWNLALTLSHHWTGGGAKFYLPMVSE